MNKLFAGILRWILYPLFRPIVVMPGRTTTSFQGLSKLDTEEQGMRERLVTHVRALSQDIADRSLKSAGIDAAADYIEKSFESLGYATRIQEFELNGRMLRNVEACLPGTHNPEKIIVLGAHYDTVPGTPGADDNASGVAALLLLAEKFAAHRQPFTLRFVAFTNEETYKYETMGSYVYAKACREKNEQVIGMFSLEMLGSFSEQEGSQNYPFPFSLFYPSKGNFIGFVGNTSSRDFLKKSIGFFRKHSEFPSQGCAAPSWVSDASRSDHLSFWKFGYPAIMVTDTSNFRYQHYHGPEDTIDKLDFDAMTHICQGLSAVLKELARS